MRCEDARVLLLEAEPEALEGRTGSELSTHVRGCPECAAAAARILRANAELDAHLASPVDEVAVAAVLARAQVAQSPGGAGPRRAAGAAGWRRAAWRPVALAAAAAGLLLLSQAPGPVPEGAPRVATQVPAPPLVEDAGAANVAVIQTDNPDITVLWFF